MTARTLIVHGDRDPLYRVELAMRLIKVILLLNPVQLSTDDALAPMLATGATLGRTARRGSLCAVMNTFLDAPGVRCVL